MVLAAVLCLPAPAGLLEQDSTAAEVIQWPDADPMSYDFLRLYVGFTKEKDVNPYLVGNVTSR